MKAAATVTDAALLPRDPKTNEARAPMQQPGYYPGFSTLSRSPFWDETTREVVDKRVQHPPTRSFFTEEAWAFWTAVFAHLIPQSDRRRPANSSCPMLDERLAKNKTVGYRYEDMPHDRQVYELGIEAIDKEAEHRYGGKFQVLPQLQQDTVLQAIAKGKPAPEIWKKMSVKRFWQMIMTDAIDAYYAHPWAWDEIGFGGPAYPVPIYAWNAASRSLGRWRRNVMAGCLLQWPSPARSPRRTKTTRATTEAEEAIEDADPRAFEAPADDKHKSVPCR